MRNARRPLVVLALCGLSALSLSACGGRDYPVQNGLSTGNASGLAISRARTVHAECVAKSDHAVTLHYTARDGARLAGVGFGKGRTGILFANGSDLDLCSWMQTARTLAGRGYRVLLFDFAHAFGASQPPNTGSTDYGAEAIASVEILKKLGAKRIVLLGNDSGALALHLAAAAMGSAPPAAIVDMGSPLDFNDLHLIPVLARSTAPILYVASTGTGSYGQPPSVGRRILQAATGARDKQLVIVRNPYDPPQSEYFRFSWGKAAERAIFAFIDRYGR
jgi:hypothetical protein